MGQPESLLGDDPRGAAVAAALVEPLVRRTATEELEPRLVLAVPSFANGDLALVVDETAPTGRLVATFRLRDGLMWHDGAPLTAADVRFAFDVDRGAAPGSAARVTADRIDRIDVLDDRTFRVAYRAGERWDLFALAPRALPKHLLDGADAAARDRYAREPVHAGPYRLVRRTRDAIVLEAFRGHVLGPPRIGRIVVRLYGDRSALIAALRAGEVDVAPSPAFDADLATTLERTFPERVLYAPAQAVAMLRFGPRFADEAVRRAISLTVDRERTVRTIFAGRPRIPSSYLVPPLWAAVGDASPLGLDRRAADALMARAGYRRGDLGIAQRDGERLVVALLVPDEPGLIEAAHGVAVDAALLGIAADVRALPAADVARRVADGDFDLALEVEAADDPLVATARYRGAGPWYDALADAARSADGRADQRTLYLELQRLWAERAVALPLFQALKVDVVDARLDGLRPAAHAAPITWNVEAWTFAPR